MAVTPGVYNFKHGVIRAVKRSYKMRAYPTEGQARRAVTLLAAHCEIYNAALQERRDAWRMRKDSINYAQQRAQLPDIRKLRPDIAAGSASAQQRTLRRLDGAMQAFFRRVKAGEEPGFPRFRSRHRFDIVDHRNGDGAKWTPTEGRWARAYFQSVGTLKVAEHTNVVGRVTQISLRREHGGRRWYVIVVADAEPEPLPAVGAAVGVDLGVTRFLTTNNGGVVDNPRFLEEAADELADLQRRRAKCKKGSGNYRRLSRRIAKLHRQVANRRRNFHHHTARDLINSYDVIGAEKLPVKNMTKRAKPRPDPEVPGAFLPNGAAAKTGLNRSIADVAWGQFISILTAKAEWAGRQVILVNPAYTSIDCHLCGARCTRPRQDTVICPVHGPHDADLNGACNVAIRAGLGSDRAA